MTLPLSLRNVNRRPVNLPAPISIDGGADQGRFLPAARRCFQGSPKHDSVATGFDNVVHGREATLIGHGIDGFFGVGAGARLRHVEGSHLCLDHADAWGPVIDALADKQIKRLTIFGCSVGAGTSGAALVLALAHRLNATVRAPTGDVWIDEVTKLPFMTKEGGWQEATADMRAAPAPRMIPPIARARGEIRQPHPSDLLVFDVDRFLPLPFAAVHSIAWRTSGDEGDIEERSWQGDAARLALGAFTFNAPLVIGGVLASFVTGHLTVTFTMLGQERTREFLVHNDRLVEDVQIPGVFYRVDMAALLKTAG